jgi:hypothetical protein
LLSKRTRVMLDVKESAISNEPPIYL